ncbi:PhnD/SsuA/transferrin family substrate-binding protein [Gimibacter soli]|uniref:PhnD/SsuA/transferrin family substrate-binding protein n=1 Tax=Gimibacter soli TaxID=3024400 RepID=A0AAE9XR60_9PROT|nr:PhnD/SsuA/transferrin family substrate-binding protein [Gimibacter soli]WCL53616.1 PhnD/SsuA/transferrin family substrate-binding protein [Gimibacter soli]
MRLITSAIVALAATLSTALPAAAEEGRHLVFGCICDDTQDLRDRQGLVIDYLATVLSDIPGLKIESARLADIPSMSDAINAGKVDFVSETPLAAWAIIDRTNAEITFRERRHGVISYRSLIVASEKSGVTTLGDLVGKVVAFEGPGSTSAFLFPLAMLRGEGLQTVELASPTDPVPAGKVGYIFTHEDGAAARYIADGKAVAGALSDEDWASPQIEEPLARTRMKVISTSEPLLRAVTLVRKDMDPELKARLIAALKNMHDDPDGRQALRDYNRVRRFDYADEAILADMERMRVYYERVKDRVG